MGWITGLLGIIKVILDRLPSRRESLLNRIQEIKDELKKMQATTAPWTIDLSVRYYKLSDELSALEKRTANLGK